MFFKRFRRHLSTGPPRPVTDAGFVAAYQATGDLELLGELYERHIDMVYAVCFNYLRDEAESQDAVMQLFEQLITDLKRHEVHNFRSWLHSVARNYCLMQLRSRRVHVSTSDLIDGGQANRADDSLPAYAENGYDGPGHDGLGHQWSGQDWMVTASDADGSDLEGDLARMHACLKTLPPAQQTCLDLFYLQEKSYAEVSQQTGYDLKQVKSYLQNGRRNLKLCLDRRHD